LPLFITTIQTLNIKDMVSSSYKPERERLPPVHRVVNTAMGGADIWCPECSHKLQYERINFNNYICTNCWYELPKPKHDPINNPEIATISTIDGWTDTGYVDMGTKTAKFRPVQGPRKDAITKVKQHPLLHTLDPEMLGFVEKAHGSMTITGSNAVINRSDDIIDASDRSGYKAKQRRKELY
jgi:DNA-directed RNA polymerase subunit RPC12/RpoP